MHKVNKSKIISLEMILDMMYLSWRKATKTSNVPVVSIRGERLPVELATGLNGGSADRNVGHNCVRSLKGQPRIYS